MGSGFGVDTSSYPRPLPATNPLDQIQKIQGIQSNALTIDKQKLDLVNQKWGYINRQLTGLLSDPDVQAGNQEGQKKIIDKHQELLKNGLIKPEDLAASISSIPANPQAVLPWLNGRISQGTDTMNAINWHAGQLGTQETGQTTQPTLSSNRPGFSPYGAVKPAGYPVQKQPGVEQQVLDTDPNSPTYKQMRAGGPQAPMLPAGAAAAPGLYGAIQPGSTAPIVPNKVQSMPVAGPAVPLRSSAIPGHSSNFGGNVQGATTQDLVKAPLPIATPNQQVQNRIAPIGPYAPAGPVTGLAPGVAEAATTAGTASGGQLAADRQAAARYQRDIFPLKEAIPALERLGTKGTGPGTETINNMKSFVLSNVPGVKESDFNGTVGDYDKAKKYLTDFVNQIGSTGTNDKLAAAFAGNPSVHISNAAAQDVAKSALALRRMQQAQIIEFEKTGLPPDQYASWATKWGNTQDSRAYGLDLMGADKAEKLKKSLKGDDLATFMRSLRIAHESKNILGFGQ